MELLGYIITGVFTVLGVIITNVMGNSKIQNEMKINQAVTDTKLEQLRDEVKIHNSFATRIPILEERISRIEKDIEKVK